MDALGAFNLLIIGLVVLVYIFVKLDKSDK
jgi:hypothetical protein